MCYGCKKLEEVVVVLFANLTLRWKGEYVMRKILYLLVFLIMSVSLPALAHAAVPQPGDPNVRVAKFWIGQKVYEVNGQRFQMDVAPYLKNGRTLLPLRFVGYALGVQEKDVAWNSVLGEATLKRWYGDGQYDCTTATRSPSGRNPARSSNSATTT